VEAIQHRSSTSIDRHTGIVAGGALFRMEFVPKGTEFEFNTLCTNILPAELKLVLLAMALYNEGRFKMGGQKSRGMGSVEFDIDTVTLYLPKLYGTDPFLEMDGEYYWISADDLVVPSLEVIYIPRDGWASQDEKVWRARLTQLAQRLYPIAGEGNIAIKVRVQNAEPQVIDVGSFALSMAGDKVEASVKPTMNGLEYEIQASKLGKGLLEDVYRSAFDFLSNIEQNKDDQEVFGRPSFPLPDGRGKMVTFTVAEESRKLHDLLVWLKLAQLLIG
jgi:hypothetical protein